MISNKFVHHISKRLALSENGDDDVLNGDNERLSGTIDPVVPTGDIQAVCPPRYENKKTGNRSPRNHELSR